MAIHTYTHGGQTVTIDDVDSRDLFSEIREIEQEEREEKIEAIVAKCLGWIVIAGFLALLSRAVRNGTLVPTLIFFGVLALIGYILYRIDPDVY